MFGVVGVSRGAVAGSGRRRTQMVQAMCRMYSFAGANIAPCRPHVSKIGHVFFFPKSDQISGGIAQACEANFAHLLYVLSKSVCQPVATLCLFPFPHSVGHKQDHVKSGQKRLLT